MKGNRRPSIRDIAHQLGISHVAVSLALRNSPRISEERRKQVQRVAAELGYHPDPMLGSLSAYREGKSQRSTAPTLAWINRWPDPTALRRFHEFDQYWRGASAAAEKLGFRVEEFIIDAKLSTARLNGILGAQEVVGLLIPPHPRTVPWSSFGIDWSKYAAVRFGFSGTDLRLHIVGNDQMRSAEHAVQHIAQLGYKRIGFVSSGAADAVTDGNFRMGYLRGLEIAHLPRIEPLILPSPTGVAMDDKELVRSWISHWKPDGILAEPPSLYECLRELKIRVPEDVGLACTSILDGGAITAGINQSAEDIGKTAAHLLIELVNRQELGMPDLCHRTLVESTWTDGGTLPPRRPTEPRVGTYSSL